ncbi:MAG: 3 beta-hydroxysteroid dehydrogenase/Delta 5--_4-isomerase [Actinobacteria bacterium ADurb.Bin346]|nr:MAG: 3 beta-hydroxysteroid dehydrogenase/Delta 5-->4-isomerase [Actinobacteria bacterium ADurb.Bin346]
MKAFVTGGTGFAGSHLIKKLIKDGHEVNALVRDSSDISVLESLPVKLIYGDITDRNKVFEGIKGMGWVFNIAAAYRKANLSEKDFWDINYKGTLNILDACLQSGVKKLVHCSTIGVVTTVKNPPGDENTEVCPGDDYQKSKCAAELEVIKFAKEKGLKAIVIRPCGIYGPGDMRLLKMFKMIAGKKFILFGNGRALYHMVYIDDLVDAFILSAENENISGEVFIIGDERYVTLNELSKMIAKEFKVPAPKIHLPYKPFEIAAAGLEFIYRKLKIKREPPIYRRRMAFFKKSRAFSIKKAKDMLGFKPKIDLATGIHLTAKWYMENKYI